MLDSISYYFILFFVPRVKMVFNQDSTFLACSQLTTSIHWPSYCIVHGYTDIHFCDSMWGFLSGSKSVITDPQPC